MPWLKKSAPTDSLAVSMSGAKLGDRLLVIGCSDPTLIASLASKAGLTGRACAVDESAERVADAARIAEREGALIETATAPGWSLPFESDSFDLVIVRDVPANDRTAAAREARRVLRPGGRCMIIDTTARSGLGALLGRRSSEGPEADPDTARRALEDAGFVAPRLLAARDGLLFVEAVKRNA